MFNSYPLKLISRSTARHTFIYADATEGWLQKRSRHSLRDIDVLTREYYRILDQYKSTQNVTEACRLSGVPRVNFYRNRYVSELQIVDHGAFSELMRRATHKTTLLAFSNSCKEKLMTYPLKEIVVSMKKLGKLMP